jgi:hypothetical protein
VHVYAKQELGIVLTSLRRFVYVVRSVLEAFILTRRFSCMWRSTVSRGDSTTMVSYRVHLHSSR